MNITAWEKIRAELIERIARLDACATMVDQKLVTDEIQARFIHLEALKAVSGINECAMQLSSVALGNPAEEKT